MSLKRMVVWIFLAVMSTAGYALGADNATSLPEGGKSAPAGSPSYFEGTWSGTWENGSDITLEVGPRNNKGFFPVNYSYGAFTLPRSARSFPSGSLKAWGKEEGDKFIVEWWKDKAGNKGSLTLEKYEDNKAKARREPPVWEMSSTPSRVAILTRK